MNLVALFLLLPPAIQLGPIAYQQAAASFNEKNALPLDEVYQPSDVGLKPDIYFIILDSYGRRDVLKDFYGYDNSAFIEYLRDRGFWLSSSSTANYTFTALSISSTLNYTYYDEATRSRFSHLHDWDVPRRLVRNNRVMRFLKRLGYTIVAINSQHETLNRQKADVLLGKWWFVNPFELGLIERTPIPWMLRKVGWPILQDWHRAMSNYSFDALSTAVSVEDPKFVFAHILLPHPPLVFGSHGEEVNLPRRYDWKGGLAFILTPGGTGEMFRDGYREQAEYVSRRVKPIIRQILTESRAPPIIILQSDHGPPGIPQVTGTEETAWRAGFGILNAMYLPYGGEKAVYEGMSPVNTFRAIFNYYFGTDYPILEDLHYMATPIKPFQQERFVVDGLEVRRAEEVQAGD